MSRDFVHFTYFTIWSDLRLVGEAYRAKTVISTLAVSYQVCGRMSAFPPDPKAASLSSRPTPAEVLKSAQIVEKQFDLAEIFHSAECEDVPSFCRALVLAAESYALMVRAEPGVKQQIPGGPSAGDATMAGGKP